MSNYDMHSHILPEMDDGSPSLEISEKMLKSLLSQNVDKVCFTPHYYSNQESMEDFLYRRERCFNNIKSVIPDGMDVCVGAEVYVTELLMNNRDISQLCYGKSNYILLEFPYDFSFSGKQLDFLFRITSNYMVNPVLAHIERYGALLNNKKKLSELSDMGVLFQTNAISYTDHFRRKLIKHAKNGFVDLLGTDAHNMIRNSTENYSKALELMEKKVSIELIDRISENSAQIFNSSL